MKFKELREELDKVFRYEERYRETGYIHPDVEDWEEAVWRNRFAILAALEIAERGEWAKCEARMPEVGASVLIYDSGNFPKIHCARWVSEDWSDTFVFKIAQGGEYKPGYSAGSNIAHWMPLPLPPEEK